MTKRVALVTGGTGGIGSAICRELAGLGHTVVASYFPPEKEAAEAWQKRKKEKGFDVALAPMDVSSFEDCERAIPYLWRVLETQPTNEKAQEGLQACQSE